MEAAQRPPGALGIPDTSILISDAQVDAALYPPVERRGDPLQPRPVGRLGERGVRQSECLQPVKANVRLGVGNGPRIEALGQMYCERAAAREVGLVDEDDRYARLVVAQTLSDEQRVVGEVLRDDEATVGDGVVEDVGVSRTGELDVVDGDGVVAASVQQLRGNPRKHLVEQPPHPDIRRSRRSMSSCTRDAARASAAMRSSISSGNAT